MIYKPLTKDYYPIPTKDGGSVVIFVNQITHLESVAGDKTCIVHLTSGKTVEVLYSHKDFIANITT